MNLENRNPIIYIIGGKARSGKDQIANDIKSYYTEKKTIILKYAKYIKDYAKEITDWNGSEETKPRTFLQQLGTDVVRKYIDNDFFIRRMLEDITVYSYFYDVIIISGARTKKEMDDIKERMNKVITICVKRPHYDNGLTEEQKRHSTEIELDDYVSDYNIINNGDKEKLKREVFQLIEEVEDEFKR